MVLCRLCGTEQAGSSEHIVLDALGGKVEVRDFICERDNNGLGGRIDAPLEAAVRSVSVLLGCRRGDGDYVAALRNVSTASGYRIAIRSGGFPVGVLAPPVCVSRSDTERRINISINGEDEEKVAYLLAHQCRRFGVKPRDIEYSHTRTVEEPVGKVGFEFALGSLEHFRSVTKSGLAAASKTLGREFVDARPFQRAVNFVLDGRADGLLFRTDLRAREEIRRFAGATIGQHVLVVFRHGTSDRIEAAFAAFGAFVFRVELAPGLSIPEAIVHVVDPRAGSHSVVRKAGAPDLSPLEDTDSSREDALEMAKELLTYVSKVQESEWIEYVAERAVSPLRHLKEDDVITQAHMDDVVARVMQLVQQRMFGGPIERQINPDRILDRASQILEELESKG